MWIRAWGLSVLLMAFWAISGTIRQAQAGTPHETFYYEGAPTESLIDLWSSLPGARSYIINAGAFDVSLLKPLARLWGADRIRVEVDQYPHEGSLQEWRKLAGAGIEFVLIGQAGLPNSQEIERLNEAGFGRCLFVIGYLPSADESARLARLQCKLSLTLAVRAYPKFTDKEGLIAIPAQVPLLFATDYWPWYTHMDTLNLLPHRKQLRVVDALPPQDSLPYLKGIKLLDDIQFRSRVEFGASGMNWDLLDGLPLTWISQDYVPSVESLRAFARHTGGSRKLVIDSTGGWAWSEDEKARIKNSAIPVEWIHEAPLRWQ